MLIETSLIAKVLILLLPQVIIFLGIPIYMVLAARKAVFSGESVFGLRFREAYNLERKLDVAIDWDDEFTWKSFANIYVLLLIFFVINSVNHLLGANLLFSIPVYSCVLLVFNSTRTWLFVHNIHRTLWSRTQRVAMAYFYLKLWKHIQIKMYYWNLKK